MSTEFFNRLLGKPDRDKSLSVRCRDSIDQVQFQSDHEKFIEVDPYPGFCKYSKLDLWIKTRQSDDDLLQIPQQTPSA